MHTEKTNNTNKLMQISYHFTLTKIQKLQKKKLFLYWLVRLVPAGIAWNWPVRPVFFPVWNRGVICTGLLTGTVYSDGTGRYGTELTPLIWIGFWYTMQSFSYHFHLFKIINYFLKFLTFFTSLIWIIEKILHAINPHI